MSAAVAAPGTPRAGTPRQITNKLTGLPRSLNELSQTARLALKLDGKMKFFNEDGREIKTERTLSETKMGQVINVTAHKWDPFRSTCNETLQSTIQSDFVDHMEYEQAGPSHIEAMSVLTKDAMRGQFDGKTVYAQDFAATGPIQRAKPANLQPVYSRHFMQHSSHTPGITTYRDQFRPQGDGTPRKEADTTSIRTSTLTNLSKGHKLGASTSYRADFGKNSKYKPQPPVKPAFTDNDSTLTDATKAMPFEGETVYQAHYLLNKVSPTQSAKPVSATLGCDGPFDGGTEYSDQFMIRKGLDPNIILRHVKR